MNPLTLSVIIPAWNEERRLPATLEKLLAFFQSHRWDAEILVVDDGSTDSTGKISKNYSQDYPIIRALALKKNSGKGAAVAAGVAHAVKSWCLIYDADSATPIEEILHFQKQIGPTSEILIGSRDVAGAHRIVKQPWLRHQLGRIFVRFRKALVGMKNIEDTQCGFKLMRAATAKRLFSGLKNHGFLFDVEILGKAEILGLGIQEIGVRWRDVPQSKVRLSREIPQTLFSLWSMRGELRKFRAETHSKEISTAAAE